MTSPEPTSASLDSIYADRFLKKDADYLAWRRQVWAILVEDFLSRWLPEDGTVVDFGCGLGEFINAVKARRRIGVDLRDSVRQNLEPGVEFVLATEGWTDQVGESTVDAVFCSNLLEHLPSREAVTALFKQFHDVLKPEGRLLILGPNLRYSGPRYWDFFDHILPLTHHSLAEALATGGFEPETMIPRFLPFTTVGAFRIPPVFARVYLRVPLLWRIVGAQFFAVSKPVRSLDEPGA